MYDVMEFYKNSVCEDMLLMSSDTPVMEFNVFSGYYKVINENLIPFQIRGCKDVIEAIRGFLESRITPAAVTVFESKGYGYYKEYWQDGSNTLIKIVIAIKAPSVHDNYWCKGVYEKLEWNNVNIRSCKVDQGLYNYYYTKNIMVYEGICPSMWAKSKDGLCYYKTSEKGSNAIEVCISNILDKTNIEHVVYTELNIGGITLLKSKCFADDSHSFISAQDFKMMCYRNNLDFLEEINKIDSANYYRMIILDYLINNLDRHVENWGLLYNPYTMEFTGCCPLFDQGRAFFEISSIEDVKCYTVDGAKERAQEAAKYAEVIIKEPIVREDFLCDAHYEIFMSRLNELGIKNVN